MSTLHSVLVLGLVFADSPDREICSGMKHDHLGHMQYAGTIRIDS